MLKFAQAEQIANALRSAVEGLAAAGGPDAGTGHRPVQAARPVRSQQHVAADLRKPLPTTGPRGPRIVPDAPNSLVLIATRADMGTLEDLIRKLDIRTPEGRGQIHVYYLQYAMLRSSPRC